MVISDGSVESIVVNVRDATRNLTALPVGTTFDIEDADGEVVLADQAATVDELDAYCQIDTNNVLLVPGDYDLYLNFTDGSESPRLGPHKFSIR